MKEKIGTKTHSYYTKKSLNTVVFHQPRPKVILRGLEPDTIYEYRAMLTDPYGNVTNLNGIFEGLFFQTPGLEKVEPAHRTGQKKDNWWEIDLLKRKHYSESGTIEIVYSTKLPGAMPYLRSK